MNEEANEIQVEPHELLTKLRTAWLNEKFSPDLLQHNSDVIDCILDELKRIECELFGGGKDTLEVSVKKFEVERMRYIICDYLRIRLNKIETLCFNIVEKDEERMTQGAESLLSQEELSYVKEYRRNTKEFLQKTALDRMPKNSQNLKPDKIASVPSTDQCVFVSMTKEITQLSIDDGRVVVMVDVKAGSQHLMPYNAVSKLLVRHDAKLI